MKEVPRSRRDRKVRLEDGKGELTRSFNARVPKFHPHAVYDLLRVEFKR